jgi:Protein of unknown function (DUF1549)/Protein of unknown function (DUF1553)/Planctomycete cytochrome C
MRPTCLSPVALLALSILLSATLMTAAETSSTLPTTDDRAFFEHKIRPVLVESCFSCHSATAKKLKGGLLLDTREGLLAGGDNGPVVIPGDPERSPLIKAIRYTDPDLQMPPKDKRLPPAVVADFVTWIQRGAVDPRSGGTAVKKPKVDPAVVAKHWAYQPLVRPAVPAAAAGTAPIDAFLSQAQAAAKLVPAGRAARPTLIRRLNYDLLGLPPTPEEIAAYVADPAPDATATATVVDRLLASPHFGERWARHWLDLARFAESHGYEQDYDRPYAYHYRDFVIEAFNRDLPYDRFVSWQLAGDELAPDDNLALMATGFIAAGAWPTQITKNEVEKARYDALDDMLTTTFTAMLGTTVGCARCHDHKYDPIPTQDYYRLLATFTTTVRSEVERDMSDAGFPARKAAWNAAHAPLTAALATYEREQLPARLAEAERNAPLDPVALDWVTCRMASATATAGLKLASDDAGGIAWSGANPQVATATLTWEPLPGSVRRLRLDALPEPKAPTGGPGRAANGTFGVDSVALTVDGQPVALASSRLTWEPAAAKPGMAQSTFIDLPAALTTGARIVLTLNLTGHSPARLRCAATASPSTTGEPLAPSLAAAIATPAARRSPAQQTAMQAWFAPRDPTWQRLHAAVEAHLHEEPKPKLVKVMIGTEGLPAIRLHTQGDDFFPKTYFLKRGDPEQKQEEALQAFWRQFNGADPARWQRPPPPGARTSNRRTALAAWMTDVDQGAGRLLARVLVNRLWQHLFGRGLTLTPSDVGLNGDHPTQPQLIDWLASDLVAGNWRMKPLIRTIALSEAYARTSRVPPASQQADPENRLWTHQIRRRLECEPIRDAMLAVSGLLDPTMFGPGTLNEDDRRRSIYFTIKRSALIPLMTVFDQPDPLQGVSERPATIIAPQALALLNNPHVRIWAHGFARRLAGAPDDAAVIERAYRLALGRPASAQEVAAGRAFLDRQRSSRPGQEALALTDFCQAVFCLNEFITID